MNKTKHGIKYRLLKIVLIPIVTLTTFIILLASVLIIQFATMYQKEKLAATNGILHQCLEITIPGDYAFANGILTKGGKNINDATLLFSLNLNSNIHATIFWGDTRILTTIEDNYGISAIGTKADSKIADIVLREGRDYFASNIIISGRRYVGYYSPLKNSDGSIVGMIFTGTPLHNVLRDIASAFILFIIISVLTAMITVKIINTYTGRLTIDINRLKDFLEKISSANFSDAEIQNPVERNDEIGEIGTYAVKMAKSIREYIQFDTLTKLYNRRTCTLKMEELESAQSEFFLALCDIDYFKKINDTYGHDCGDFVLREISSLFLENTDGCGFASRWGGEEFLLIYHEDRKYTHKKVSLLLNTINNHQFVYNNTVIHVTITIGISECNASIPHDDAIRIADDKLYKGKASGRNTIIY